jgi:aminoglycoside 3-N-acetyltransferase
MVSLDQLRRDLGTLGVPGGAVLVVHTSLRAVGWVEGGARTVIDALRAAVGPEGTLVMPSMTDGRGPFDPRTTPTDEMGIVAETFWRLPGVLRSTHPNSAFAAEGPLAKEIVATHPLADPEGIDSPIGRVYRHDGWILLLGVGHDANTTIHVGESLSGVKYRRIKTVHLAREGVVVREQVPMIDHCCGNFEKLGPILEREEQVSIGRVGNATAQLMPSRAVVERAKSLLRENELYFLCPEGIACDQCEEARSYAEANATA